MLRPRDVAGRLSQPRQRTAAGVRAGGGAFANEQQGASTTGVAYFDVGRFDEGLFGSSDSTVPGVSTTGVFDFSTFDRCQFGA